MDKETEESYKKLEESYKQLEESYLDHCKSVSRMARKSQSANNTENLNMMQEKAKKAFEKCNLEREKLKLQLEDHEKEMKELEDNRKALISIWKEFCSGARDQIVEKRMEGVNEVEDGTILRSLL